MKWIGLTGGIATGKSTVAKLLRDEGLPVIDADSLAREVVAPDSDGLKAVVSAFGRDILCPDGSLDREKLGRLIFSSTDLRLKLEGILHPLIQERKNVERLRMEREGAAMAFYDVPLLFEKNLEKDFDKTVLVFAPAEVQRARLRERDGLSEQQIESRMNSQLSIDEKLKRADYVIFNQGSMSDLKANVSAVLKDLTDHGHK